MRAIVVGGGLLGLSTAYHLAQHGVDVVVLESGGRLGGLATDVEVDGIAVDRFYHCILNADHHLIGLIDELGLSDQLRLHPVRAGFYRDGTIHSISTPLDLLRFPPLGPIDRARLVWSLLACRRVKDWHELEQVDVETWLRRRSGERAFETVWRPLLSAKFDGDFRNTPATYIWSRTVRMTDTRSSGGRKELAGHLVGGYRTLAERLAERIREAGGTIRLHAPAERLVTRDGAIIGVVSGGETLAADAVVLTTPLPLTARLLSERAAEGIEPDDARERIATYTRQVRDVEGYLGVVCLLLMLRRRLSPYYTLYLADDALPFTAIIETTNLIDPALVGGRHLVYLPKYVHSSSAFFAAPDDAVREQFLAGARRVFPDLRDADIVAAPVFRAPHVEPLHPLGSLGTIPPTRTPIGGLWLGSTKHFYPRLNNGEAVTRLGYDLAGQVIEAAERGELRVAPEPQFAAPR